MHLHPALPESDHFDEGRVGGRDIHTRHHSELTPARSLRAECPVLAQCRRFAISSNEPFCVWGGTTARERALERVRVLRAG
ncbi:WhiB family transcriptional regulator [Rhodococcus sp. PAMC28707]|nr:WhiB family transcriptional regulator [Rhodococcus sp. PAMC28705]QCB59288.1 WhiB family transcriptional regulator [Rhodococcus sp. PAMC28707]